MKQITVTLDADKWPAVLYALEQLAEQKARECRTLAEANLRNVREAIKAQVEQGLEEAFTR